MGLFRRLVGRLDRWQRRTGWAGAGYGVAKKFGEDRANLFVVSLAWYGFTAIFPLLLAVVTIFGFIGQKSIGSGIIDTLHKFPVIGADFNPANSSTLHGSALGLAIGLVGLLYGAQGVTQTAQQAMAAVWNVPQRERTSFLPRLWRSFAGLFIIGVTFVVNAAISTYAAGSGRSYAIRIPVIAGLLLINVVAYLLSFLVLTGADVSARSLLPGAIAGAIAFTLLITVGTGLMTHQLQHASATYGAFGSVIGLVSFMLLLAKLSMYAAELNPVLARSLYPRALPLGGEPTDADRKVLHDLAQAEQRSEDQTVGVGFGDQAEEQAAADAARHADRD